MPFEKDPINKFDFVYRSTDCYYGQTLRDEFTDYFNNREIAGKTALDLGCGEGRYALYLARRGCRVTALDRSSAGISKLKGTAEKEGLSIQAESVDIQEFIFPESRYEIIIAATVLDHLPNDLRSETIRKIKAALSPGGIVYANVFTVSDPGCRREADAADNTPAAGISDTAPCMAHYFAHGELKSVFSGLEVLFYYEGVEPDLTHGRPHHHGWACLLAKRPLP